MRKQSMIFSLRLLLLILIGAFTSSCKKEYVCRCVITTGANSVSTDRTVVMRKKDARETCEAQNSTENVQGITTTTKCQIM